MPLDGCGDFDLHAEYSGVRGVVALGAEELLPVSVPEGTQPCTGFGVNPVLPLAQELPPAARLCVVKSIRLVPSAE